MSDLADVIVKAVREHALGPDWRNTASAYPLQASGGRVSPDAWWPCPKPIRSREGNPEITIYAARDWAAMVTCSPTGKNITVFIPEGTRVVEVSR